MGNVTAKTSGEIASFMTPAETNIKSLKVHFSPKQDLHGYSKPWVAGGGKNLCPDLAHMTSTMPYPNIIYEYNPNTYTWKIIDDTGGNTQTWRQARFFFDASAMAGKRVCLSYQSFTRHFGDVDSQVGMSSISFVAGGASVWVSPDQNKKWIDVPSDVDLTNAEIGFRLAQENGGLLGKGAYIEVVGLQIEVGDTGTNFEPYENICPIEGWDGVEVNGSGKNLLINDDPLNPNANYYKRTSTNPVVFSESEKAFTVRKTIEDIGNVGICEANHAKINATKSEQSRLFVAPQEATYIFSVEYKNVGANYGLRFYKVVNNTVTRLGDIHGDADEQWHIRSFTVSLNKGDSFKLFIYPNIYWRNMQIEIANTPTDYEPYQGNNILTNWTKNIKQWTYTDTTIDDSYSGNNFNGYGNGRWDNVITDIPSEWFGKELTYSAYIERSSSPLSEYDDARVWCYGESITIFDAKRAQRFYDADTSGRSWVTFTIPEGTERIAFGLQLSKGSRAYNPQLEYGSKPTEYQPYVGTVYGGYIDLISGELIENYKDIRLDANTQCTELRISDNGLYTIWYYINDMASGSIQTFYNDSNILCNNIQKVLSRGSIPTTQLGILFGNNRNNVYLYNMNYVYGYTTKEEISAWLDENPVYVTVPLATPITHQLTPTQLSSFIGQNNFWSNADYVEIEYDLIETEDIQKVRKKIMLNQPHTESVIGDIASFTTNMKAPLKECKVYFNPIQEGSGDPSPDNVRPISGWTGVNIYNDPKYGGNIVWNQCLDPSTITIGGSTSSVFDVTTTETGFNVVLNGDVSESGSRVVYFFIKWNRIQNHRYIFLCKISNTLNYSSLYFYHSNGSTSRKYASDTSEQFFGLESYSGSTSETKTTLRLYIYGMDMKAGESFEVSDLMAIDLDEMFGTSVIDELYENTITSAQKIDWFKNIIKNYNYHEYNAGEVTTVSAVNGDLYTSIPINWSNNVGTIYGGYIDLAKGELVANMTIVEFDGSSDENWQVETLSSGLTNYYMYATSLVPKARSSQRTDGYICSNMCIPRGENETYISGMFYFSNSGALNVYLGGKSNTTTVAEFKSWLTEHKLQIAYWLETPIHYSFTPQQLLTFKGENNIWSDTNGQTEVKYWTY